MLSLALLFVLVFFIPVKQCVHLAGERETWFMWYSCICLLIVDFKNTSGSVHLARFPPVICY